MAISTADFKNGMCIEFNGKLCTIVEFQHVKPGKGSAFVRTKLRDIKTGRVIDNTFNAGVKVESVRLETRKLQYLYNDGADFNFMDNDTFEQMAIPADTVGAASDWLKENDEAWLLYAADELTGLIGAAALMRPSKSAKDMELKSLKKKFKDKKFAAGCSRDVIARGAELLGWDLDKLLDMTLRAMRQEEAAIEQAMTDLVKKD